MKANPTAAAERWLASEGAHVLTNVTGNDGADGFMKCAFYDCDAAQEELTHTNPNDAIAFEIDNIDPGADAAGALAGLRVVHGETITAGLRPTHNEEHGGGKHGYQEDDEDRYDWC